MEEQTKRKILTNEHNLVQLYEDIHETQIKKWKNKQKERF